MLFEFMFIPGPLMFMLCMTFEGSLVDQNKFDYNSKLGTKIVLRDPQGLLEYT